MPDESLGRTVTSTELGPPPAVKQVDQDYCSHWACHSSERGTLVDVAAAITAGRDNGRIQNVCILPVRRAEVEAAGIEVRETTGATPYIRMREAHRDVVQDCAEKRQRLGDLRTKSAAAGARIAKSEIADLLQRLRAAGELDEKALSRSMHEELDRLAAKRKSAS